MSICFATSRRAAMRPLACQGIYVTDCHSQLKDFLSQNQSLLFQNGMLNAATFLAEPMSDDKTGLIDWYVEGTVAPEPYSSLPAEEQDRIRKLIETYAVAFQELLDTQGPSNPMAAEMLTLALQHPSAEDMYVLDGLPVLINWGFKDGTSGAVPENIMAFAPSGGRTFLPKAEAQPGPAPETPPIPEPQGPIPEPQRPIPVPPQPEPVSEETQNGKTRGIFFLPLGCLSWLLPLLLLLLLLWLLLAFFGRLPVPLPAVVFPPFASSDAEKGSKPYAYPDARGGYAYPGAGGVYVYPDEEAERARRLLQRYQELMDRLSQHAALCVPKAKELPKPQPVVPPAVTPVPEEPVPPAVTPVPEETVPPAPEESAPDIDFSGEQPQESKPLAEAEIPDFGTPVEPPAEPETPKDSPKKGESMEIPDDAAKKKDFSFLDGCWESQTGMVRTKDNSAIIVELCFNKKGRGKRLIHEVGDKKGNTCKGKASAQFKGNTLYIKTDMAYCPAGSGINGYTPNHIVCTGSGNTTRCHGVEDGGLEWDAEFHRK